jgi:hypothetical protein
MQGRRALAAILVSAGLTGCGAQAEVEPASIEIVREPVASIVPAPSRRATAPPRVGRTKRGTFRAAPTMRVPSRSPVPPASRPTKRRKRADYARFRAGQLEVLRAHCATRPKNDPRCKGTEVDERVAFAPFEGSR